MEYLIFFVALAVAMYLLFTYGVKLTTVHEYEKGLKYDQGRFEAALGPGQYWHVPFWVEIRKLDMRPRFVSVPGQEVLSRDGVSLKVSLAANYEITDPRAAFHKVQDYQDALYLELQLALRRIISAAEIDSVLATRDEMSDQLMERVAPKAEAFGLKLIGIDIKDIMFPSKLKEVFAQVVNARKEGHAALEKARGETAALRSLANAAKMLDSNPNLMHLRLVQALGESSGNTLVLGIDTPKTAATAPPKTPASPPKTTPRPRTTRKKTAN